MLPPAVKVGSDPVDLSLDQATGTVYVANWGNGTGTTVSVIDGRTCNGQVTSGCGQIPATVTIGTAPAGVIVDEPAGTVYAATVAPSGAEAVWVIDGATCNPTTTSGCGQKPASVRAGAGSADYNVAFAIDPATQTLYVANWKDNTLSVIGTATCNATTTSGCARTPHAARVGSGPDGIALDLATDTLYVSNITSGTVSVLDAATCNATVSSGCGTQHSRILRTGQAPQWVTVDQATDTLYVPNADAGNMSVLNGATCNAAVTSGCNQANPGAPNSGTYQPADRPALCGIAVDLVGVSAVTKDGDRQPRNSPQRQNWAIGTAPIDDQPDVHTAQSRR